MGHQQVRRQASGEVTQVVRPPRRPPDGVRLVLASRPFGGGWPGRGLAMAGEKSPIFGQQQE